MSANRTYILAPSFDYGPGSSITLGNVIADSFAPHRPLTRLAKDEWPESSTTVHRDVSIVRGQSQGGNLSVGAQMLEMIGAKIRGHAETSQTQEYAMSALRTEYFVTDPKAEHIGRLLKDSPQAARVMESGLGTGKLFIITGLKIAEGFSVSTTKKRRHGADVGADVPIAAVAGLSVGNEVGGFTEKTDAESFKAEGQVVLAYRLLKITSSWRNKEQLNLEEYQTSKRERFLSDGEMTKQVEDEAAAFRLEHVTEEEDLLSEDDDLSDGEELVVKKTNVSDDKDDFFILQV